MRVEIKRRGLMLVLSSPSGAGKTTLSRRLLESDANVTMSVSATTRSKRPSEVEGRDYFFVDDEKFRRMAKAGEFLEHAQVFGHHYGTPKQPVLEALAAGRDVLFDIDWQGTQQLRQQVREDVVTIFVLPPSREELERRLRARAQDSAEVVKRRMAKANDELSHWAEYDYVILNDDIVRAQTHVETILAAERLKRVRQPGIPEFVEGLMRSA
ncbi:MAG: guanylate kinase [Alphaproteobacteria bacterium]|nr:guanylate kinase [Alphaproteobacteria bacterium]MDE2494844.1 guanylate kinase [Alphaproteobacteria bacterium]